ncbi:hypothetical protein [Roseicyclus mahoneyensis]|jgi:hypothetical protein|uniref:hypothetical protein n=1 Tax=Roseicyclus mahoneyensis TaxID=164332 RepID=UPI0011B1D110|nr:hypothetical protein [Roseicyclus mahoneyensis]
MQNVSRIPRCFQGLFSDRTVLLSDIIPVAKRFEPMSCRDGIAASYLASPPSAIRALNDVCPSVSAIASNLNAPKLSASDRRRIRHRFSQPLLPEAGAKSKSFLAEAHQARSADLVSEVNANPGGQRAVWMTLTHKTEQRRCDAMQKREDLNHG